MSRFTHSNRVPITKEDNGVHGFGKVHSLETCTKPTGTVAKSYKQKRDNRRFTVAGV